MTCRISRFQDGGSFQFWKYLMLFQLWNWYRENYSIVQSQTRSIKHLHNCAVYWFQYQSLIFGFSFIEFNYNNAYLSCENIARTASTLRTASAIHSSSLCRNRDSFTSWNTISCKNKVTFKVAKFADCGIQQLVLISVWLYSKLSYTQANFIVWYRQLIWTIYKIKCSKNIQELKTQANFRGTYKVRNEIETKRNEINENETKRNEINEIKRNQRKQNEINENKTK